MVKPAQKVCSSSLFYGYNQLSSCRQSVAFQSNELSPPFWFADCNILRFQDAAALSNLFAPGVPPLFHQLIQHRRAIAVLPASLPYQGKFSGLFCSYFLFLQLKFIKGFCNNFDRHTDNPFQNRLRTYNFLIAGKGYAVPADPQNRLPLYAESPP